MDKIRKIIREILNQESGSKYFSNIGLKTEDVFDMIEHADSYTNLYPGYEDNDKKYPDDLNYPDDFYYSSEGEAYEGVNEILQMFNDMLNPIPIYRTIKVKSLDDINYSYLGESWSFEKESAINFAKMQAGGNVLLSGKTKFDNVDWPKTLRLFFQFSYGRDDGYNEDEINVIDSDEIFDLKVEKI